MSPWKWHRTFSREVAPVHSDLMCEAAGWILELKPAPSSPPLHCAMAAPSVEYGNIYKLIKKIPWRWAYIEWVLFIIKYVLIHMRYTWSVSASL